MVNMFKQHQTMILVAVSFISLIVVIALTLGRSRPENTIPSDNVTTSRFQLEDPTDTLDSRSLGNINFLISDDDLPRELPVYQILNRSKTFSETMAIARGFGIQSDPSVLNDIKDGTIFVWREDSKYLRVEMRSGLVNYKPGPEDDHKNDTSGNFLDQDTLIFVAKNLLENSPLLKNESISFDSIEYFVPTEAETFRVGDRDEAALANVKFVQSVNGFRLVNDLARLGTLSVIVDRSGNIFSVSIDKLPSIELIDNFPTALTNDIKQNPKKVTVYSLAGGSIDTKFDNVIVDGQVFIDDIEIVYLQKTSGDQNFLQPVYLLRGSTTLLDEIVEIELAYPAIKNSGF